MKKLATFALIVLLSFNVKGQEIPSAKIEQVLERITNKTDTTYVINFWSTFCVPCVEEIPYLQSVTAKYADKKVKLILVSLDFKKTYPVKLNEFIQQHHFTAEIIWLNETNADHFCPQIDKKWSGSIPATLFVNNKTGYKKFLEEQIKEKDFEQELKKAIGE